MTSDRHIVLRASLRTHTLFSSSCSLLSLLRRTLLLFLFLHMLASPRLLLVLPARTRAAEVETDADTDAGHASPPLESCVLTPGVSPFPSRSLFLVLPLSPIAYLVLLTYRHPRQSPAIMTTNQSSVLNYESAQAHPYLSLGCSCQSLLLFLTCMNSTLSCLLTLVHSFNTVSLNNHGPHRTVCAFETA